MKVKGLALLVFQGFQTLQFWLQQESSNWQTLHGAGWTVRLSDEL
jgi:hypothetical protein